MRTECPTRLLSDLPASKDAFGAHARVADAIATLLMEEEGGKAIALTGTWGSGKSTVVQLLRSSLARSNSSNSSIGVFVYDAWVHQGDPLRRSFLETLTSFLAKQGWILPDKWQDALDSLSRRREETTSESQPLLTWPGRLMALSALLLPLGYTLFSKYGDSQVIAGIPIWIVGLLLSLSPLLIAILTWISWRPTWRVWTSEFWTQHRAPHEKDSVVSFFVSKIREVNRSHTIRTPDPTSIEFQGLFHDILDDALGKNKRTLLIVMDNLDRIPPQEALSIWSTMRTFFHTDNPRNSDWLSRFWLLVPFDRSALQRLWNTNENGPDDLVTAFVNKSFQIEFRVSEPVLSDWKKFFLQQLMQAFPEHAKNTDELNAIYRLFRLKGLPADRPLTPRDIKLFINKIGALHRQWGDQIPLVMQSLYVLCKEDIRSPAEDLTKDNFLKPLVKGLVSDYEWQKYLAALHFNVDPEKSLEVLIGRTVEEAFSTGEPKKLVEFQDIPGFRDVCDLVLEENHQNWAKERPASIAAAALVLQNIASGREGWDYIWKWLVIGAKLVDQWTDLNDSVGQGIVCIIEHASHDEFPDIAKTALSALTKDPKLTEGKDKQPEEQDVHHWVDACLQVVAAIDKRGQGELIQKHFCVPGSAASFVYALNRLREKKTDKKTLRYFRPKQDPSNILSELVVACKEGRFEEQYAGIVETMITIDVTWPWPNLVQALNERLQANNNLSPKEVKGCIRAALLLAYRANNAQAKSTLQALSTHGHLMHQLQHVHGDPEAAALCMLPLFEVVPDGSLQATPGQASAGVNQYNAVVSNPQNNDNWLTAFTDLILEFQKVDLILQYGREKPNTQKLASAVLEKIIQRGEAPRYLSAQLIIEQYQTVSQLLSEEARTALVDQLVSQGNLISALTKNDFAPELGQLYVDAFRASKGDDQLAAFLKDALKTFDTNTWINELLKVGPFLEIILLFIEKGEPLELANAFHDALREHAQKIRVGKATSPSIEAERWTALVGAMEDHWQETFIRNLWDDLIREPGKPIETVCSLYGNKLLETEPAREKADEIVRQVYSGIIERGQDNELEWLAKALGGMRELYMAASESTRKTFEDRVRNALLSTSSKEARTILEDIARKVGLDPDTTMAPEKSKEGSAETIDEASQKGE